MGKSKEVTPSEAAKLFNFKLRAFGVKTFVEVRTSLGATLPVYRETLFGHCYQEDPRPSPLFVFERNDD